MKWKWPETVQCDVCTVPLIQISIRIFSLSYRIVTVFSVYACVGSIRQPNRKSQRRTHLFISDRYRCRIHNRIGLQPNFLFERRAAGRLSNSDRMARIVKTTIETHSSRTNHTGGTLNLADDLCIETLNEQKYNTGLLENITRTRLWPYFTFFLVVLRIDDLWQRKFYF